MVFDPASITLRGRTALVTGAASGIGQAIALTFARFGAELILCDRKAEALEETALMAEREGPPVQREVLDVRDADAVERFVSQTARQAGKIDVLVNNAGGTFHAAFSEVNARGQQALIDENFGSVSHLIRAVLPHMPSPQEPVSSPEAAPGASIINITSIEAHRAGPGFAIYAAMKAAVHNLTKSLALELGDRGIRVNCIAPDMIPTPGIGPLTSRTPLVRRGCVDDVAAAALYLATPLSAFTTGTTLHVDGGNHAAGGWHRNESGAFEL